MLLIGVHHSLNSLTISNSFICLLLTFLPTSVSGPCSRTPARGACHNVSAARAKAELTFILSVTGAANQLDLTAGGRTESARAGREGGCGAETRICRDKCVSERLEGKQSP